MHEALLEELLPAVRRNCLISDARFWGYYSLCGLLLRLRELYRFEKELAFTEPAPQGDVEAWIGEREAAWSGIGDDDPYEPVVLDGTAYDPFDAEGINGRLIPAGLLYGAGYGVYMKPLFFLAELAGQEQLDGCTVLTAGREYARDLALHPAMFRQTTVTARIHVTEVLMAQKFEELRAARRQSAVHHAFRQYGVDTVLGPGDLERIARSELRTYIHHELGEAAVSRDLDPGWTDLALSLHHGRAAAFVHDVRDVMADSVDGGLLDHVVRERKLGSLAFHVVFLSGFRRPLSCRIEQACREVLDQGSWDAVERGRKEVYRATREIAGRILEAADEMADDTEGIERAVLREASRVSPA